MFAHWATAQAQALAAHLLGKPAAFPKPEHNSAVIFSHPEFATAGLTVAQAQAAGLIVDTATYDYAIDARAQIGGETGLLRLVFERDSRRIVGVHALIEGASDLIGEGALIVRHGLTLEQLAQAIHPHPTLTESMGVLARQTLARLQGLATHAHHPVP
jgi:dihydrolipoamide dehydrogenase